MGDARGGGRLRRILDVGAGAMAALLAFGAVPTALIFAVGNPLSGGLGHTWPAIPRASLCILAVAAWVAWAECCAQLTRAVVARVRTGEVRAGHGVPVVDRIAARIAIGVLALSSVGTTLAGTAVAGGSVPPAGTVRSAPVGATSAPSGPSQLRWRLEPSWASDPSRSGVDASAPMRKVSAETHQIGRSDSLRGIADARLGDGADWVTLAALNLGSDMAPGARFIDPDHLRVGWTLRLPQDTSGEGSGHVRADLTGHLPELVTLGLGSLACAALARRAKRRRRLRPFVEDGRTAAVLSDPAVDTAVMLHRFGGLPALGAFESANLLLGWSLGDRTPRPGIRLVSVDPEGVSFWLSEPDPNAPEGFGAIAGGQAWHVGHAELDHRTHSEVGAAPPGVPLAFPAGDDGDATWLVTLGAGDVLPVLGESAHALWRGARATLESWDWSDTVVVVENADDPVLRSEIAAGSGLSRHVLFFGDPQALPSDVAARVAVVTAAPAAATDLTLLVDRHGTTLHPIGRVLHPHLLSEDTARYISELVDDRRAETAGGPTGDLTGDLTGDPVVHDVSGPRSAPGTVDVRLLTVTPRLDGLGEALAPNRARRAVELVAYLAIHRPDVVTSDRLRTRVLGSSDADAASKTLFNTAHAARRAMGADAGGTLLFPAATRSGQYQVSSEVSVDVHRAASLCAEARAQCEPELAIAYYRAALDLVEGEPLANVLSGYSWWEAEGHSSRVATMLVDAACAMARLATDSGHLGLARWGIEQAKMVEPYSEALSRAAMEVAAAAGDADRLRLEWRACQRMVDTLDPGSSPSLRTESLYGELSRRVLVSADSGQSMERSETVGG